MNKISKYLNILTTFIVAITVVLLGMLMWGGELPNTQYDTPVYMDQIMWWAYTLLGLGALLAVFFAIYQLFTSPKQAVKTLIGLVGVIILVLIAYSLSDGTIMNIPGYTGTENTPEMLKFTDTILFIMYITSITAVGSIIVTEVIRNVR